MSTDPSGRFVSGPELIGEKAEPTHLQLLSLLRNGEALTQAEMTERLPIGSKRQARRLVKKLKNAGVPVEASRRGSEKEYCLPPEQWETRLRLNLPPHPADSQSGGRRR